MDNNTEVEILEQILFRAAEQLGDITEPVMAAYYARFPEAKASFDHHSLGNIAYLEGQMVENSVFCLMRWVEAPSEIRIMFAESVPHHNDTLRIPPEWYAGLIEATADVIGNSIPADRPREKMLWDQTRQDLRALVEECRERMNRNTLLDIPA